jgi:TIM21
LERVIPCWKRQVYSPLHKFTFMQKPGTSVVRSTARTSNLLVILLGASLSVLLVYALATELYAENSPTVLYRDACDMIKKSEEVDA